MSSTLPPFSQRGKDRVDALQPSSPVQFYDKERNPDGIINLTTAENSLMTDEVLKYMHGHFQLTGDHLKYRNALRYGYTKSLIQVLPKFLNRTLKPRKEITSSQIVIGPGLGAIFSQVIWHLCDEGDGVLITAPLYADYPRDIVFPSKAVPVVPEAPPSIDPLQPEILPYIRKCLEEHRDRGKKVPVMILNNPHNPLASPYNLETIIGYVRLAEEFNIHLLADEVFANEIYPSKYIPNPAPFTSILGLDTSSYCSPSRIHVLAGPTKDFGASGIKVGGFISQQNPSMVSVISNSLAATPISAAADALFTAILDDTEFCDWFLEENRLRLSRSFELVAEWCDYHKLPFVPAQAGVFVLIDFGPFIDNLYKDENDVDKRVKEAIAHMAESGVRMRTPADHADPIKTRFRIVHTLPAEIMKIAFYRLEVAFKVSHYQWP